MYFRNHHELSCALHYAQRRNRGRQASFKCSFTLPYIWMCAQKVGSNTLETCSWDSGWVLWKSAQRVQRVQRVHEVQIPSSLMDDTHQSSAAPNSLMQLQGDYASRSDDVVPGTPEKQFEEEDGQSNRSEFHTPAQPSKRRRLPSVSPVENRQVYVPDSDSDGVHRESDSRFSIRSSLNPQALFQAPANALVACQGMAT